MLEEVKRKEVDKRDKQLPQSFEQLIQMYDLNKIWKYIEEIEKKQTSVNNEFLLYSGDSNGSINLSDSADNYNYIEIFFRTNDNVYDSTKVYQPNNKLVSLVAWWANVNVPRFYTKVKIVTISGTSIQAVSSNQYGEVSYDTSSDPVYISNGNNIYITRVIGYRNKV